MAAAYLFHLAMNHPFIDGNKRTAAVTTGVFLARNGYRLACTEDELYDVTIRVATNQLPKPQIGDWIREHLEPMP